MQKKFGAKDFAVISVHVKNPETKYDLKQIQNFLSKTELTIPNFYLQEEFEFWSGKLGVGATPLVYVFDRQGRWRKFGEDGEVVAGDVDAFVQKLMKE